MRQDPAEQARRLAFVRHLMTEVVPFNRVLGIQVLDVSAGRAVFAVPFRQELVGDPDRPALHGGVLSAVADACGGAAVWSMCDEQDRVSTIDLRIDYLRPARLEVFHAIGTVLRVGNRVGVANVALFHPGAESAPVAEAKGVYSVKRRGDT